MRVTANFLLLLENAVRTSTLRGMVEDELTPAGALIEEARLAQVPKMSMRKAAAAVGISDAWWRQIVRGYKTVKGGAVVGVDAPADTLARMADLVGVTAEQLRQVNQEKAAERLDMIHQSLEGHAWSGDLSEVPDDELMGELQRRLKERLTAESMIPYPPLQAVARRIDPADKTTFHQPGQ